MPQGRSAIPRPIQRAVKEEAGYRCAIPACGQTAALEYAHIVPHSETQDNSFENLICLCSICHHRYDNGEIPRQSIRVYKANLGLISHRYMQSEVALLRGWANDPAHLESKIQVHPSLMLLYQNLVTDGLLEYGHRSDVVLQMDGVPAVMYIWLKPAGIEFVKRMAAAKRLEPEDDDED